MILGDNPTRKRLAEDDARHMPRRPRDPTQNVAFILRVGPAVSPVLRALLDRIGTSRLAVYDGGGTVYILAYPDLVAAIRLRF